MNWQRHWYGEGASFLHKCVMNGLVFGALLCVYAVWTDFLPSEFWWRWGSVATALLSLALIGVLYQGFKTGQLRSAPGFVGWKRVAAAGLVLPLVLFGMLWLMVVRVVPDFAARVIGRPAEVTSPMRAVYSYRRGFCDYRLEGEILSRASPVDYLCVSPAKYSALQGEIPVTLRGRETQLGMHLDQVLVPVSANKALQATRETRAPEADVRDHMRYVLGGILGGFFLYVLLAAKDRLMSGAQSPDERIRSLAQIGGVVCLAMVCWELFEYFFREQRSTAALLALTGVLGGFQLGAEVHWHVSVGRHQGRKK